MPDGVYVRMLVFGHAFKQEWDADGHNAQDILKMIEELKPDVLDRFVDGKQNPNLHVPVAEGSPEMTELEFLQAAMKAGAPGCTLAPKVHLNKIWSDEYRMEAAQSLRDLPLTPRLTMVDLDSWFSHRGDAAGNKAMLQKLRKMGWTIMVTNPGPYKSAYGYESSVMTYMSEKRWQAPKAKINALHEKGIKLPLLHIDYPAEIRAVRSPPSRPASRDHYEHSPVAAHSRFPLHLSGALRSLRLDQSGHVERWPVQRSDDFRSDQAADRTRPQRCRSKAVNCGGGELPRTRGPQQKQKGSYNRCCPLTAPQRRRSPMAVPVYKDTSDIIARLSELAMRLSKDHLTPITGKEMAPLAAAIAKLAEQVKLLEEKL